MIIRINKEKRILGLLIYYILLCIIYDKWIAVKYSNTGFSSNFSLSCFLISWFVIIVASYVTVMFIERDKISDIIVAFLLILYLFPQSVLFAYSLNNYSFYMFVVLYFFILCILNWKMKLGKKRLRIKERGNLFETIIVVLGLLMILISGVYSGFRLSFNMSDYYEYRFEVRELAMPTIFRYVLNWARMLIPIGFTYSFIKKKRVLVAFTCVAQMLCFSFDGKKSGLFMFALALLIAVFYKHVYKKHIPGLMSLITASALVETIFRDGESFIGKNIIRRMMFVPSYLGWAYYDYFSQHEFDYLKSSILRWFGFKSQYGEGIPRIIGGLYYITSSGSANANTGLCGDAFSNFGWASVLFYPIAIILVLKLLDKYMDGIDERIQLIVSISVAYTFINGSFFSVLLTNGILLMIVLFIVMPRENGIKNK